MCGKGDVLATTAESYATLMVFYLARCILEGQESEAWE